MAARLIWWEQAEQALRRPERVIAQVMEIGDFDTVLQVRRSLGDARLAKVLQPARATAAAAAGFVLYGGTAIALRCGHRVSVDFDFFTARPLERAALQRLLPWLKSSTVLQDQASTFTVLSAGDALRLRFPGERSARCVGVFRRWRPR
jgi:hypothetical protein